MFDGNANMQWWSEGFYTSTEIKYVCQSVGYFQKRSINKQKKKSRTFKASKNNVRLLRCINAFVHFSILLFPAIPSKCLDVFIP